jgi:3-phenylpropionate/trans-cinnamate dioxygenase ferredoxin subunit
MRTHCVALCQLNELVAGEARRFEIDGLAIAVVRIADDVYAIGDRCTHENVSLSEGEVDGARLLVECWKHGSQFSLVTGEPHQLPAIRPTPVYPAEVRAGEVLLTLPMRSGTAPV